MNYLNQIGQQFVDLFKSMTPAARIVTALLTVAIGVSLFFLFKLQSTAGNSYLFGGTEFFQNDVSAMTVAFGKAGLNDFEVIGNRIQVPRAKRDQYLKALAEHEAIPESVDGMYDVAKDMSPFTPQSTKDQMVKDDKKKNIQRMIQGLAFIQLALVETAETDGDGPFRRKEKSAVVTVTPTGSHRLEPHERRTIFNIVANSLNMRDKSRITIADTSTNDSYTGPSEDEYDIQNDPYTTARNERTREYKTKIREALVAYTGARVSVEVQINPTISKLRHEKTFDSTGVPVRTNTEQENSKDLSNRTAGVPGTQSNVPGINGSATVRKEPVESTKDRISESTENVVGRSIEQIKEAGLDVQAVSVSVGIPEAFVRKLWHKTNPPAEGEEIADPSTDQLNKFFDTQKVKIEEKISALIPNRPKGEDAFKNIVVMMDPEVPIDPLPEPAMTDYAFTWLAGNWQVVALFFFGGFSLVALRGMVKSTTAPPKKDEPEVIEEAEEIAEEARKVAEEKARLQLVGRLDADPAEGSKDEEENELMKRFGAGGRPVREQLTELVVQNPEAAATILRAWIGEAV